MKIAKSSEGMLRKNADSDPYGQGIKVTVVKNKTASPFKKAEFCVYFDGREESEVTQIADIAIKYGLIPRYNASGKLDPKGRTYKWESEPEFKATSKADVAVKLAEFPNVCAELKAIILKGEFENIQKPEGMSEDDFETQLDNEMEETDFDDEIN